VKPLERGGAAVASTIERLRRVERLLEPLQVSTDSLMLCRAHEVLAPLLEWSGANDVLRRSIQERRPGVPGDGEALDPVAGPPADTEPMSRRRRAPSTAAVTLARPGLPVHSPESSAVRAVGGGPAPAAAAVTPESRQRAAAILAQAESDAIAVRPSEPAASRFLRREWLVPAPERIDWQSPVSRENAAHRLESVFARDERLLRAWERVVADEPGPREVVAILKERGPGVPVESAGRESHRVSDGRPESVTDPLGVQLEPVVERAWRARATAATAEVPARFMPGRDVGSGEARPSWTSSPQDEGARQPLAGPARMSGLRRLASYGETIEAPRVLPTPAKSAGSPVAAPQRPVRAESARRDLGHEVTEIFRREALRHGIVAEEDTL
jgi:hypothetical protein